ncbi:MAG: Gfo/Idh/MocA family oxidoreductase [Planctomycetota bacterium]|nr:Gfo/Idh/MocA family oxidoreductase [Planctomycetota bacterium]
MASLKIAFVGAGHIARLHAQNVAALPDVEVRGFCDLNAERAAGLAREFRGAEAFTSATELYDAIRPDAAYVCVTPDAHGVIEIEAARRGIHLFIEKPQCIDADVGRRVEAAVREAGILASIGYQNRYRRSVERARELLALEPPILALGHWIGHTYRVPWWSDKRVSGGQLVEQSTHTVDLIRHLVGEPVEVYGRAARGFVKDLPEYHNDDASAVTFTMPSGCVATVLSCCANVPGYGVGLKIFTRSLTLDFTGWEHSLAVRKSALESENVKGEENIFAKEDAAFVDAIRANDVSKLRCTYADGLKTALLTLAATEALDSGRTMRLDAGEPPPEALRAQAAGG